MSVVVGVDMDRHIKQEKVRGKRVARRGRYFQTYLASTW